MISRCFQCVHLSIKTYIDGTTLFGCEINPGIVRGSDTDDPQPCEHYRRLK